MSTTSASSSFAAGRFDQDQGRLLTTNDREAFDVAGVLDRAFHAVSERQRHGRLAALVVADTVREESEHGQRNDSHGNERPSAVTARCRLPAFGSIREYRLDERVVRELVVLAADLGSTRSSRWSTSSSRSSAATPYCSQISSRSRLSRRPLRLIKPSSHRCCTDRCVAAGNEPPFCGRSRPERCGVPQGRRGPQLLS